MFIKQSNTKNWHRHGLNFNPNAPINSKVQHPPGQPPGQPPGHLNFGRLACSNSLPSGQKSRSNAPPISTELPLLKDKFRLQSTLYMPFRERYAVMTPWNFFERPFWKSYSLTKAKFYLVNPSNPAKTEKKTHGRITSEQEINPVQIPHPSKATFKFPPPRARCTVKCPGYARGGGMLKFRIDRRIRLKPARK